MPQKPQQKNTDKKNKRKHPRAGAGRGMLYGMLVLALLLAAFLILVAPMMLTRAPRTAMIRIPAHATRAEVHDTLTRYMGDAFADKVLRMARFRKTDFANRHGAYEIKEGTNSLEVMRILTSGAQTPMRVTFHGVRNIQDLLDRISARLAFGSDSLSMALYSPELLEKYGLDSENAMAMFIDDTYEVYWSATPGQVIDKIGRNYTRFWDDANRKKAARLGLKPVEVMILASIVDEESNAAEEKGTIGRLYINRLKKNMRLQADPTVRYATGDFTIKRITSEHLSTQSPYNTYLHVGLPPGPIRTTSKATVQAILDSKPNDYLYMCAKEELSGNAQFRNDIRRAYTQRHALPACT